MLTCILRLFLWFRGLSENSDDRSQRFYHRQALWDSRRRSVYVHKPDGCSSCRGLLPVCVLVQTRPRVNQHQTTLRPVSWVKSGTNAD